MMHHYKPEVYEISRTAYRQLCKIIYGSSDMDLAPDAKYIVVECLMSFGGSPSVRPVFGDHEFRYAVEDAAHCYERARRVIRRGYACDYEIWHVVPDYLLSAVYAVCSPEPEQPSSDTVSPVVFATEPDTGKQLVFTPDKRFAYARDALDVATIAINLGYDNVGIVWMRSDWAMSQTLAIAHLYMLGYSLYNRSADRLEVL